MVTCIEITDPIVASVPPLVLVLQVYFLISSHDLALVSVLDPDPVLATCACFCTRLPVYFLISMHVPVFVVHVRVFPST